MAEQRNRHFGNSLKIQDKKALIHIYAILWSLAYAHPEPKAAEVRTWSEFWLNMGQDSSDPEFFLSCIFHHIPSTL